MDAVVLDQLDKMSEKDLKALRAAATLAIESKSRTHNTIEGDIYLLLCELLRGMNYSCLPLKVIKGNPRSAEALLRGSEGLAEYIDKLFKPKRKLEKMGIQRMLLKMLIRTLTKEGREITPHLLIRSLPRIPEIVDTEFPGYRENGFLPMLLRKFQPVVN